MNPKTGVEYARIFFGRENSKSYDNLALLATLGQDSVWKKKIVCHIPSNSFVLDLACGTGILSSLLIENRNKVVGLDLTLSYLEIIMMKGLEMGIVNANAELLPFADSTFDCITTSYLPKYTNLDRLIEECFRVLKFGGCIVLHDFTLPKNTAYKFVWAKYFKLIKYLWGRDRKWKNLFANLDTLIKQNDWDLKIEKALIDFGFTEIKLAYLTFQTSLIVTATKK